MIDTRALLKARIATLLEHFHIGLPEIAELTDRQIGELYFHARNEDGTMKVIAAESTVTFEYQMMQLDILAGEFGTSPEELEELKCQCRKKWGK